VFDGSNRRDSRDIQRHLHKLAVGLVKVACVSFYCRHTALDVFQHQVVFWLFNNQCSVHVAKNQIIAQRVLLFEVGVKS